MKTSIKQLAALAREVGVRLDCEAQLIEAHDAGEAGSSYALTFPNLTRGQVGALLVWLDHYVAKDEEQARLKCGPMYGQGSIGGERRGEPIPS